MVSASFISVKSLWLRTYRCTFPVHLKYREIIVMGSPLKASARTHPSPSHFRPCTCCPSPFQTLPMLLRKIIALCSSCQGNSLFSDCAWVLYRRELLPLCWCFRSCLMNIKFTKQARLAAADLALAYMIICCLALLLGFARASHHSTRTPRGSGNTLGVDMQSAVYWYITWITPGTYKCRA